MEPINIPTIVWLTGLLFMICGVDENKRWQKIVGALMVGLAATAYVCFAVANLTGNG